MVKAINTNENQFKQFTVSHCTVLPVAAVNSTEDNHLSTQQLSAQGWYSRKATNFYHKIRSFYYTFKSLSQKVLRGSKEWGKTGTPTQGDGNIWTWPSGSGGSTGH